MYKHNITLQRTLYCNILFYLTSQKYIDSGIVCEFDQIIPLFNFPFQSLPQVSYFNSYRVSISILNNNGVERSYVVVDLLLQNWLHFVKQFPIF